MVSNENVLYGGDFEEPRCVSFGDLMSRILSERGDEIVLVGDDMNSLL
jgi:hypothetical protein